MTPRSWPAFSAGLRGAPSGLPGSAGTSLARNRGRRRAPRAVLPLGARVPRSLLRRSRRAAPRCRVRRGDRQPALGGRRGDHGLQPRVRLLLAPGTRPCQPLSVVRRADAPARRAGRTGRHADARGSPDRSRLRVAPSAPVRALRRRRDRRLSTTATRSFRFTAACASRWSRRPPAARRSELQSRARRARGGRAGRCAG